MIQPQVFPRQMYDPNWAMTQRWPMSASMMNPMSAMSSMLGGDWSPLGLEQSLMPAMSSLDIFDPFDDLDNLMGRNMDWLSRPQLLGNREPMLPRVPNKYRVSVDCAGFRPKDVKTEVNAKNELIVQGKQEDAVDKQSGDFCKREFKKTYQLPANSQKDQMISFMSGNRLICEVPLQETEEVKNVHLWPEQIKNEDGTMSIQMAFNLPENIDPKKVNVSVKDHDLIVRIEDKVKKPDSSSQFHYYQRTTLPDRTKLDELKCVQEGGKIICTAPIEQTALPYRTVPIQQTQQKKQVKQN